jgi:leucyl-tRNA synthetase
MLLEFRRFNEKTLFYIKWNKKKKPFKDIINHGQQQSSMNFKIL